MSNRWGATLCAVGLAASATLSAQTGTAGRQTSSAQKPAGSITLAGCLQGGTGSAGTTASPRPFVLTNTTSSTAGSSVTGGPAPSGTTGTTAGPPPASSDSRNTPSYVLDGFDTELAQHVGHRIEVTGTLAGAATSPRPGANAQSAASDKSSDARLPHIEVTGVRMIASTCPGR